MVQQNWQARVVSQAMELTTIGRLEQIRQWVAKPLVSTGSVKPLDGLESEEVAAVSSRQPSRCRLRKGRGLGVGIEVRTHLGHMVSNAISL